MNIHFVCRANIYRSRLAEAYFRKLTNGAYKVSSSGVEAQRFDTNYSSSSASILAKENNLDIGNKSQRTTNEMLNDADIIVFVKKDVYLEAKNLFKFDENKVIVWDVHDIYEYPFLMPKFERRRRTWNAIKKGVESLIKKLESKNAKATLR